MSRAFLVSMPKLLSKGRVHPTFSVFTAVCAAGCAAGAELQASMIDDARKRVTRKKIRAVLFIDIPPLQKYLTGQPQVRNSVLAGCVTPELSRGCDN
jgi:hypothetical protein